jgi:oxygen-independent coproporphyrinogen-3 oxidase
MNLKKTALYIHIPFCDHKCIYCDFYSLINYDNVEEYLSILKLEIAHYAQIYSNERIIDTIFFGGGTPSFMKPSYIQEIIEAVDKNFILNKEVEITLETNPGTVTKEKLIEFKNAGINRISIGVQTFDEEELKFLTRIHDKKTAINTIENSAEVGFENISLDLIFSLPNQSLQTWENNLKIAVDLPIKHISAYSLILERGTILNKMVLDGKVKMATENHDANLYKFTMDFLAGQNFNQYEISNFAKENYECKHNLYYWEYNDYLSFGTAAHSFVNGTRWWNFSSLKKYIDEIKQKGNAVRGTEKLNNSQMLEEIVMLGLRSKGINLDTIKSINNYWLDKKQKKINILIESSYIKKENNILKCTPKGYMICDELITELL